jgi:hypothetical protein
MPSFEEFVLGHAPDAYLSDEERTARDMAAWDAYLTRVADMPAQEP